MARLPDPILDNLMVEWPEESEHKTRRKSFKSILAEAVRKAESNKKIEEDKNES